MIALMISILLIIVAMILKKYTHIMTKTQFKFIITSSILYIFLFGVVYYLLNSKGIIEILSDDKLFFPLIFYILWFGCSASVSKVFTMQNNYSGFFDKSKYMSERETMPS